MRPDSPDGTWESLRACPRMFSSWIRDQSIRVDDVANPAPLSGTSCVRTTISTLFHPLSSDANGNPKITISPSVSLNTTPFQRRKSLIPRPLVLGSKAFSPTSSLKSPNSDIISISSSSPHKPKDHRTTKQPNESKDHLPKISMPTNKDLMECSLENLFKTSPQPKKKR